MAVCSGVSAHVSYVESFPKIPENDYGPHKEAYRSQEGLQGSISSHCLMLRLPLEALATGVFQPKAQPAR